MYKLFTDKAELFECDIKIEGTSLSKSTARLVVETSDYSLMFNGKISSNGKCEIPVKKLRGLIDENSKGNIRLEVIAEDTYFIPWKSEFEVDASKKVTVEVKSQASKKVIKENKIQVSNIKQEITKQDIDHVANIMKLLVRENIDLKNLHLKKNRVNKIVATYTKHRPLNENNKKQVIRGVLKGLYKK
jgi:CRISPR/Cas system-associated exonuclease Cas4 (RecB family)|tara:strand:+ start:34 stop:597 length:564 start_codon:yes stop_codon:yes gene_type:complete